MQPNLQEQMLLNGQVDFSAVFTVTSYVNLIGMKVDPDKDIRWIFFADHGVDLYSNGIMVSQKLLKEKPKAVAGLVRALNRAIIETAGATERRDRVDDEDRAADECDAGEAAARLCIQDPLRDAETDEIASATSRMSAWRRPSSSCRDLRLANVPTSQASSTARSCRRRTRASAQAQHVSLVWGWGKPA